MESIGNLLEGLKNSVKGMMDREQKIVQYKKSLAQQEASQKVDAYEFAKAYQERSEEDRLLIRKEFAKQIAKSPMLKKALDRVDEKEKIDEFVTDAKEFVNEAKDLVVDAASHARKTGGEIISNLRSKFSDVIRPENDDGKKKTEDANAS